MWGLCVVPIFHKFALSDMIKMLVWNLRRAFESCAGTQHTKQVLYSNRTRTKDWTVEKRFNARSELNFIVIEGFWDWHEEKKCRRRRFYAFIHSLD